MANQVLVQLKLRQWVSVAAASLLLISLLPGAPMADGLQSASVYFIPFDSTTITSVTQQNIVDRAVCNFSLEQADLRRIEKILQNVSLTIFDWFDDKSVRVKFEKKDQEDLDIDRTGVIKQKGYFLVRQRLNNDAIFEFVVIMRELREANPNGCKGIPNW